jgi:uncharacterized membrane protein
MTTNKWRTVSRTLLWICHIVLLVATVAWLLARPSPQLWLILLSAVMITPLLFATRGLVREQIDTYRWLSLVLVIYIGAGSTEVVASQRTSVAAVVVMLAALAELSVLVTMIRNAPPARRE